MSSSSTCSPWQYSVFLSFRGEDTRDGFVSHLYNALCQRGIRTFIDEELPKGDRIEKLLEVIEQSRIFIVVYSENYASSRWCLREAAKIMQCMDMAAGHHVLPVFYKVNPFEVRLQGGITGDHFAKHEMRPGMQLMEVAKWRAALTALGGISGWHITHGRPESMHIQGIVNRVMSILEPDKELYRGPAGSTGLPSFSSPEINSLLRPASMASAAGQSSSSSAAVEAGNQMLDSMKAKAANDIMNNLLDRLELIDNFSLVVKGIVERNQEAMSQNFG